MPLRVVYIDDESDLCGLFRELFASASVEVLTFSDPKAGLDHVLKEGADVVFLDYRMPGLTGLEIAERLPHDTPKYLITGEVHLPANPSILKVFLKPYDPRDIEVVLENLLKGSSHKAS